MNEADAKRLANTQALRFIVSLLILYLIFSQGNLFMNSVMSPGSRFYNGYVADNFNYIQALKTALIKPSVWLIKLGGFYAISNQQDIMVVSGPLLRINYSCLGLGVMSFLAAFVLAFPARCKETLKMLAIGVVVIYVLNICRIAGLGILFGMVSSSRSYFDYHHEIFNIIVYIIIFIMLYIWIRKNSQFSAK